MPKIRVYREDIEQMAQIMSDTAKTLNTQTEQIKTKMKSVKGDWNGVAAESFIKKVEGLTDDFQARYSSLTAFADFLNKLSPSVESRETSIQGAAEGLQ